MKIRSSHIGRETFNRGAAEPPSAVSRVLTVRGGASLARTAALATLAACALGGGAGGGDDALPVAGTGPFTKLADPAGTTPLFEPFVVVDPLAAISDPAPLLLADGSFRIYFTHAATDLRRVDLPADLAEPASDPVTVLQPTAAEARTVAPAVVRRGGELLLYFETADGVALARSTDEGASFVRDRLVLAGAAGPGAVVVDDRVFLYYTRAGDPRIYAAISDDGAEFDARPGPVLTPGEPWDLMGLADPAPIGGRTAAGQIHVGLYVTGTAADGTTAIGYAGSRDGLAFELLPAPVLDAGAPSERGASALAFPARVVLFFTQDRAGKLAVAAASEP